MIVLAFDTATADTAVGLLVEGAPVRTARHEPAPGDRPGHAAELLGLARGLLAEAGLDWHDVERIGVGTGPGTFTGLRIGVATARALAQAGGQELVGISTLEALARGAASMPLDGVGAPAGAATGCLGPGPGRLPGASRGPAGTPRRAAPSVLACLDARRGEAYVAAWRDGAPLLGLPRAVAPDTMAALLGDARGPWSAVGDGSVRFREQLEAAGAHVPPDGSAEHHVDGVQLCGLALTAAPVKRDALEPDYVRAPDAVPTRLR